MDPIFEAYTVTKSDMGMYADLEELVHALLWNNERAELIGIGKQIGERIQAALDEAYPVAPEEDKKAFKEALVKGLN